MATVVKEIPQPSAPHERHIDSVKIFNGRLNNVRENVGFMREFEARGLESIGVKAVAKSAQVKVSEVREGSHLNLTLTVDVVDGPENEYQRAVKEWETDAGWDWANYFITHPNHEKTVAGFSSEADEPYNQYQLCTQLIVDEGGNKYLFVPQREADIIHNSEAHNGRWRKLLEKFGIEKLLSKKVLVDENGKHTPACDVVIDKSVPQEPQEQPKA